MIEELGIKTLDDVDVEGKCVFVRVDFNSPVDPHTKKLLDDARIRTHSKTVEELIERKARIVLLAHQGRKGEPDFISLKEHAKRLSEILHYPVKFVDDIFGEKAKKAIKSLEKGEVLLLENVRMWDGETKKLPPEEHAKSELVRELAPFMDIFCVDAFAAAHRSHASMVGFMPVAKEVVAGRVMEQELKVLYKVRNSPEHPCIYILGGAKAEDSADLSYAVLSQGIADYILTGGLVANLFLYSQGVDLGSENIKILEKKGFIDLKDKVVKLLEKYGDRILLPVDLAVDASGSREEIDVGVLPTKYLIKDIGSRTCDLYASKIKEANTVVMNGPMGIFEEKAFSLGTEKIFDHIVSSQAFSLIGGGHTIAAARKLGFLEKFSYVSTAGGALVEYLIKGSLPVVEALRKYSG
ncbi:MAG: phosphoglycerate kinase [Thermoprotei archaeon]|nr:MAG: phosphoglycerate kinase [Thermoprotei archaeon]